MNERPFNAGRTYTRKHARKTLAATAGVGKAHPDEALACSICCLCIEPNGSDGRIARYGSLALAVNGGPALPTSLHAEEYLSDDQCTHHLP